MDNTSKQLEICIIFCDKDFNNLYKLIENINKNVVIPHVIHAWDNRQNNNDKLQKFDNVTYYNVGKGNIYQFKARQELAKYVDDDSYVWYVDGDDNIYKVDLDTAELTNDIVLFNCRIIPRDNMVPYNTYHTKEDTLEKRTAALWDKWIKGSLLKKAVKDIPEELDTVAYEDKIINLLCYKNNNYSDQIRDEKIYEYNMNNGYCGITDMSGKIDIFLHNSRGFVQAKEFIRSITTDDYYKQFITVCFYNNIHIINCTKSYEDAVKIATEVSKQFTLSECEYLLNVSRYSLFIKAFNAFSALNITYSPKYKNNKTGNVYSILYDNAIECTNGREDISYTVYTDDCGKIFVRETDEFKNKFTLLEDK